MDKEKRDDLMRKLPNLPYHGKDGLISIAKVAIPELLDHIDELENLVDQSDNSKSGFVLIKKKGSNSAASDLLSEFKAIMKERDELRKSRAELFSLTARIREQYHQTMRKNDELTCLVRGKEAAIAAVIESRDTLREALSYYAEKSNWVSRTGRVGTSPIDLEDRDLGQMDFPWAGGKKAREALEKVGKVGKG